MRLFEKCMWIACGLLLAVTVLGLSGHSEAALQGTGAGIERNPAMREENVPAAAVTGEHIDTIKQASDLPLRPQKQREIQISNKTHYQLTIESEKQQFSTEQGKTAVLIVHTHGSEAYTPDAEFPYIPTDTDRTDDCSRNVVAAGRMLEKLLRSRGIVTYHDETLHDDPSYSGSYARSLTAVEAMLDAHKDIGFVIDLHRDAFLYEDGTRLRCTCTVDGEKAAQIMLVVGTDAGGLYHPSWRDNLDFAVALQQELENANPGITRPIDLRTQRFNQHVSKGALIVELGASGNTLGEALRSVPVLAEAIAAVLTEQSGC